MSSDKITITLFSKQQGDGYNETLFREKDNIAFIRQRMTEEAVSHGREPPEIVVSVLLIPDWKKVGNSYEDESYLGQSAVPTGQIMNFHVSR